MPKFGEQYSSRDGHRISQTKVPSPQGSIFWPVENFDQWKNEQMSRFVDVLIAVSMQLSCFCGFHATVLLFYVALRRRLSIRRSSEREGNLLLPDIEAVILKINACGLSCTVVVISHTMRRTFPFLVGEIGWSQDCHSYASSVSRTSKVALFDR